MNMLPKESLQSMYQRRNAGEHHDWPLSARAAAYDIVRKVVRRDGGYREKYIMRWPHIVRRSGTWNAEHKVVRVLSVDTQPDGHRDGFAVDIVTRSIVG